MDTGHIFFVVKNHKNVFLLHIFTCPNITTLIFFNKFSCTKLLQGAVRNPEKVSKVKFIYDVSMGI